MLAEPESHFTRIQGSKLWHLALLEWWLQVHVDGVAGESFGVSSPVTPSS
ncbi:MAG: hypothetical protein H7346_23230, partial [Burkholderiaceae bacterium]|nr:hypothetical protein [Burkholderiaceae bacterium]